MSIVPQEYFVKRIGGDRVSVNAMIQPGTDAHTYEPKPEQLKTTAQSQAYFKIGVSLEDAWKDRLNSVNQQMLIVDTSQGVDKIPLTAEHDHDHDHAKEEKHQAGKNTLESPYLVITKTSQSTSRDYLSNPSTTRSRSGSYLSG